MVLAEPGHKTILEKRNRKMQVAPERLRLIIFEEYLKEEGILQELTDEQKEEILAWIRGSGPRPKWATDDLGTSAAAKRRKNQAVLSPADPSVDRAADTMPLPTDDMPQYDDEGIDDGGAYDPDAEAHGPSDIPSDDAPERDVSGFQDRAGPPLEDQLMDLIQGMPPEEVSDLFQAVFSKIPGVEIGPPEEEDPETLYSPGAEGRPTIGFREIKQLIRKVLAEGHYHDMGDEQEMYNALDPYNFEKMTDAELIDMMHKDGMEELIVADGEGGLINREEVIAALKDV